MKPGCPAQLSSARERAQLPQAICRAVWDSTGAACKRAAPPSRDPDLTAGLGRGAKARAAAGGVRRASPIRPRPICFLLLSFLSSSLHASWFGPFDTFIGTLSSSPGARLRVSESFFDKLQRGCPVYRQHKGARLLVQILVLELIRCMTLGIITSPG